MKDIVNIKFIKRHQDEILKLGDVILFRIMKYIDYSKIEKYFKINKKEKIFCEDFETIEEWIYWEKDFLSDYDFYYDDHYRKLMKETEFPEDYTRKFEEYIELMEDWVDCYPDFENVLAKENFKEYIENDGVIDQSEELGKIEKSFHEIIMQIAGPLIEEFEIPLPHITMDLLKKDYFKREEFPVPGMYGGFYYYLGIDENWDFFLNVDSWSRICGGSGKTHIITANECELVDEGYV